MTIQTKINGRYYCGLCTSDARGGVEGTPCPGCGKVRQWEASVPVFAPAPQPAPKAKPRPKRRPKPPSEPDTEPEPKDDPKEDKRRGHRLHRKLTGGATPGDAFTFSEGEFARSWASAHDHDEFLFVTGVGWLRFSAGTWSDGAVAARRGMADLIHGAVQQTAAAPKFDRASVVAGALRMAEFEPSEDRTVEVDSFDSDILSVGLPGGRIFEVVTGKVRPAKPQDRLRKALAIAPDAEPSSLWATFVYQSLAHYPETERDAVALWLQEYCGAMLTGDCSDQKALFIWGTAGTGKSVFAETLRHVMGSYAGVVAGERLAGREGSHRQWVVGLAGRRLVLVSELPERARWNVSDLNALVEGGPLEANSMRSNSIVFNSQASVILVGNHRPRASAASGIWRRLVQVEFRNKPETPDPKLLDKLKSEAGGVLAWMIEGAARWHTRGSLPEVPTPIRQAVESYRREADPFAQFLDERTVKAAGHSVGVDDLYADFREFWLVEIDTDEKSVPKKRGFGVKLGEAGWPESVSVNGRRVRTGYRLAGTPEATTLPFPRPLDAGVGE